jgi:2-dehydro-3-deoxygalactonokinase
MTDTEWIAIDWGTSRLRVWGMLGNSAQWHESSRDGMGGLAPAQFEPALLSLIAPHLATGQVTPALACGMIGARQGWIEAGYRAVPCNPFDSTAMILAPMRDARLRLFVIGGLKQDKPADVMRGEETQIAGFQAMNPKFDGVMCLPGSHSKWVQVSAGEVISFQTFMTGELFAALKEHSVLRHSIGHSGWDDAAFSEAVAEVLSRPEKLAAWLFSVRAETLLHALSPESARARLSGALIGAELAGAKPYWLGQQVALIGGHEICAPYAAALRLQGVDAIVADSDAMTLKGLAAGYAALSRKTAGRG